MKPSNRSRNEFGFSNWEMVESLFRNFVTTKFVWKLLVRIKNIKIWPNISKTTWESYDLVPVIYSKQSCQLLSQSWMIA